MKWPRGKYNGERIVGVRAKVVIDVTQWWLCCKLFYGTLYIHIGPVHMWIEKEFRR